MVWPGPAPEIDALALAHVALACAYAYTESLGLDRHFDRCQTVLTPGPSPRLRLRRANARKAVHVLVEATPEPTSRPGLPTHWYYVRKFLASRVRRGPIQFGEISAEAVLLRRRCAVMKEAARARRR